MSVTSSRPVLSETRARPAIEGAGVHLHRAFGFSEPEAFDPFLMSTISAMMIRAPIRPGFRGTRIAALKPSPMFCPARWNMATALAIAARLRAAMCNG